MGFYPSRIATLNAANPLFFLTLTGAGTVLPVAPDWWGFLRWNFASKGPTLANALQFDGITGDLIGAEAYGFNSATEFAFFDATTGADPAYGSENACYNRGTFLFADSGSTVFPNDTASVDWLFGNFGPYIGGPQAAAVTVTLNTPLFFGGTVFDNMNIIDTVIPASSTLAVPAAVRCGDFLEGTTVTCRGIKVTPAGLTALNCWSVDNDNFGQIQPLSNCVIGADNWTVWSVDDLLTSTFALYLTRWQEQAAGAVFDNDNYTPEFDNPALTALLADIDNVGFNMSSGPLGFVIPYNDGTPNAVVVSRDWTSYGFIQIAAADPEAQDILDYAAANPGTLSIAQDDAGLLYVVAGDSSTAPHLTTGELVPAISTPPYIPPPAFYQLPCYQVCQPLYLGRK
jgi:hypothetical protein